jgi:hypothetical protein
LLVLVACSAEQNNQLRVWDNYQSLAVEIDAQSGSASLKHLTYNATKLTDLSLQLLPNFVKKQSICLGYIQDAMAAKVEILTLPLSDVEEYYHADGKLPVMQDGVCYHAKDLLVQLATAVVISKTLAEIP